MKNIYKLLIKIALTLAFGILAGVVIWLVFETKYLIWLGVGTLGSILMVLITHYLTQPNNPSLAKVSVSVVLRTLVVVAAALVAFLVVDETMDTVKIGISLVAGLMGSLFTTLLSELFIFKSRKDSDN